VDQLFDSPRHPYTRGLLASVPHPHRSAQKLAGIPGTVPNLLNPPIGCRFAPRCMLEGPDCATKPASVAIAPWHTVACHRVAGVADAA
jgi:peptide/nickel transport system ATP-binding protein